MGKVRKTFSIATLGIVKYRSKAEKIALLELAFDQAERELDSGAAKTSRKAKKAQHKAYTAELNSFELNRKARRAKKSADKQVAKAEKVSRTRASRKVAKKAAKAATKAAAKAVVPGAE